MLDHHDPPPDHFGDLIAGLGHNGRKSKITTKWARFIALSVWLIFFCLCYWIAGLIFLSIWVVWDAVQFVRKKHQSKAQ